MKKDMRNRKTKHHQKGIKAGNNLITVTNPSKELLKRFERLKGKQFDSLQDFIQALEATKIKKVYLPKPTKAR
jgi:hypothetical protein